MNAGSYTERLKARSLFAFHRQNSRRTAMTYETRMDVEEGAVFSAAPATSDPSMTIQDAFFMCLDEMLSHAATKNLGPTRCTRTLYLWFATVAGAYNWVTASNVATGVQDDWNWGIHHRLFTAEDQRRWMCHVFAHIMPVFIDGYNPEKFTRGELDSVEWNKVRDAGAWFAWAAAWRTWYTGHGAAHLSPAVLPNGTIGLDVGSTVDPATYPHPTKWTPLIIRPKKQTYLTYNWHDVKSARLTTEQETTLEDVGSAEFPTDAARAIEIADLLALTQTLTDTQKVIAEFWAGGPGTVSPPGMFIWFWKEYMICTHVSAFPTLFYSGLDLAAHLFETSRVVWGLKRKFMQARPIQEIRRLHRDEVITHYDGTTRLGAAWVPYQTANFVTPPFADYPSGHSAFGRSFANVMTHWFGPTIAATPTRTMTDAGLICPVFIGAAVRESFARFTFPAGASEIQGGVVPAAPVRLEWTTWREMADSCGVSRQYGGIHAASAHTGSVAVADALHGML